MANGNDTSDTYDPKRRLIQQYGGMSTQSASPPPAPPPMATPAPGGAPSGQVDPTQASQTIMQQLMRSQRSTLPAPHPDPIYRASSGQGLLGLVMMGVQNALASHKQKQVNEALGRYETLNNAWMQAQDDADKAGNPNLAVQLYQNSQAVQDIFYGKNGEKNAKRMQDLLHVDFMDPESMNTVEHHAFGQLMKKIGARNAMTMMKNALSAHRQQSQGAPPTPGSQLLGPGGIQNLTGQPPQPSAGPALAQSLASRAVPPQPLDAKSQLEVMKSTGQFADPAMQQRRQAALDLGMDPKGRDFQEVVLTGKFPTIQKPTSISKGITGQELGQLGAPLLDGTTPDPKKLYDVWQNTDGTTFAMPSGIAQNATQARLSGMTGSGIGAIMSRAVAGDPNAQSAFKLWLSSMRSIRAAGAEVAGQMRLANYVDGDSGESMTISAYDAAQMIRQGRNIVKTGELTAPMVANAQRIIAEGTPALAEARKYLGAYDNAGDRAIFAKIMGNAGAVSPGNEGGWLTNVLNQAATANLSSDGQALVVRLKRLSETVGNLRAMLGAPATDSSMGLMLGLIPGGATPNSKFAGDVLDQLEANMKNATGIPILRKVTGQGGGSDPALDKVRGVLKGMSAADQRKAIQGSTKLTADQKKILLGEVKNGQRQPN